MKLFILIIIIFNIGFLKSQENGAQIPIIKLPAIKPVKLINKNDNYQFNTAKWQHVDTVHWLSYFNVENNKIWTGQQVADIRVLGSWGLGEASVGYLYAIDVLDSDGKVTPSVFISSYNATTQQKGIDINPFKQAPAPTGMKGKVTITETLSITKFGVATLKSEHKSVKKTLSKTVKFSLDENGAIQK